jgi:hypothetical protein
MLMLIDTREPPDDEGSGSGREPWIVGALGWLLPWPAMIVWLCVASRVLDGWPGVAAIYLAIGLTAWRGLHALPTDGLDQQRQ